MKKLLCVLMFGMVFGQAELTTRVYELDLSWSGETYIVLDLFNITEYDLDFGEVSVTKVSNYSTNTDSDSEIYFENSVIDWNLEEDWAGGGLAFTIKGQNGTILYSNSKAIYDGTNQIRLRHYATNVTGSAIVSISVTAPFPEEDTGYIEEGFDYCIEEGANLIASPCRDAVPILDALPSEIANNLTGIIGQGVAATNEDGVWAGSLSGLGGGNGYWMLSNVNACFNYNCAEN